MSYPTTMRAAVYEEYGEAADVLTIKSDVPVTPPSDSQVVIKVAAAGINPVAWKLRKGFIKAWPQTLPMIPGWDVAGTIVAAGSKVSGLSVGDEVYSYNRPAFDMKEAHPESAEEKMEMNGCCAEYVTAESWKVALKPKSYSMAQASGVPLVSLTAFQGLFDHGKLEAGQTVLILNASGGVGSYAVGLSKAHGATVIGCCSGRSAAYVESLGADNIIDYTLDSSISEQAAALNTTIDLVLDCIGGDSPGQAAIALKDGGKLVSIAGGNGAALAEKNQVGIGFLVQPNKEQLEEIATLCDNEKIKTVALTEHSFNEIVTAHQASESGRTHGKNVLIF